MNPIVTGSLWWLAALAIVFAILEWGQHFAIRWLEGWMIPHSKKQERCRVQCATCRE